MSSFLFQASFEVGERTHREIVSVDEYLEIYIDSVHNIPDDWKLRFYAYCTAVHVLHGTEEICHGIKESPKPITKDHFFSFCKVDILVCLQLLL